MEENIFIERHYLRIYTNQDGIKDFGFVTNLHHTILSTDIELLEKDYNTFFKLQEKGKQFKLKEISTGKGLFDYLEEYTPQIDTTPQPPSEMEILRADVDYLAIVTGVEL